ncbi:MAG TPA: type I pullulanase, partial [Lachnospiraceae bacterium]|nr:type I pullulanase [Lachnospiraceae bacterium]
MKKSIVALGMIAVLLLSMIGSFFIAGRKVVAAGKEELKVNIHYHRYDNSYDGWNAWVWLEGMDGAAYKAADNDEFGTVISASFKETKGIERVGFIIRLNEWEAKDGDGDRFVEISNAKNNQLDIYLVQGDNNVYYSPDEVDLTPRFLNAYFATSKEIRFSVTAPVDTSNGKEADYFTVKDSAGVEYPITKVWSNVKGQVVSASLIMEQKLDLSRTYTIARKGYGSRPVAMGEAFSSKEFEEAFYYDGTDLGTVYTPEKTDFRVWAPTASRVNVKLYKEGDGDNLISTIPMGKDVKGTWVAKAEGDMKGVYYTYAVTVDRVTKEAVDPYARATGVNGRRGMIIDLPSTNPTDWNSDVKPDFLQMTDAIIYELHVRDLSSDASSGIKNAGKYLGLKETGTKNADGLATGIDHLKELGITHLHLLPSFDYATVDETKLNEFNWGYDPQNYNVPEGSYSTDPYHGEVRVNEYKQMVQALHSNGIRVVMDVVYNHTSVTEDSNFNSIVPDYYYRKVDNSFSNASGCGNETASERAMVRKYIVDSVVYWATEYHVDGFRFDLMGIHDIDTMNAVRAALDKVDTSILIYGEGWTAAESPIPDYQRALKANTAKLNGIAAFSDDLRDGIKGSVFNSEEKGFVSGAQGMEETIKFGIVGATNHPQVDYTKVNYSDAFWAGSPAQCINYVSAHDNLTFWDKLASSNPDASESDRVRMTKLSSAILFTSQGIPFFQAGEEILRSKPSATEGVKFDENSYRSPDSVNSIKWDTKTTNIDVYNYYKGLIEFRKAHPALRLTTTEDVSADLVFMENMEPNVVAYTINNQPNGESAKAI